ncbi:MAG TPA: DcaP family trimeric outer membrane transporter, partial [Nitrospiraceae bacterium]
IPHARLRRLPLVDGTAEGSLQRLTSVDTIDVGWPAEDIWNDSVESVGYNQQNAPSQSNGTFDQDRQAFLYQSSDYLGVPPLKNNFTADPNFDSGIVVYGSKAAMKIGGYVKADFIKDFDAIGSKDTFDTTTIPVDGPQHENVRFHARQSRLSFDTRWRIDGEIARVFIEGDFFGGDPNSGGDPFVNSDFRLRHAFGRLGRFTGGQTWTTFTDPAAVPPTIDFEGAVSNVNRRQGLARWDQPIVEDVVFLGAAVEDPQILIENPDAIPGEGRTESPDFITRLRYEQDWGEFQGAMVLRKLGFQPTNEPVITENAWGFNFTGSFLLLKETKGYYQITFGEGIGSYRGSPDVVATGPNSAAILPMFGWMVGVHHDWNDSLTSNVTFSKLTLKDIPGQAPTNLRSTTYLAVNLIANPYERVFCGIEYLFGIREDVDGDSGDANRLQMACGFYLP